MNHRRPASAGPRSTSIDPLASMRRAFRLLAPWALTILGFIGFRAAAQAQGLHVARYANVIDRPFATVSNGPQSAVVLDLPANATEADEKAATLSATRSLYRAQNRALAPQIDRLRQRGLLKNRALLPVSQIIAIRRGGVLVQPAGTVGRAAGRVTRSVGGGTLTFSYSGFNSTDQAFLEQVAAAVYPSIVNVYGQPAVSGNVTVVNAGDATTLTDKQYLAFGVYDPSNNQILLPTFSSNESFVQAYILMMIHAFHGPAVFQYDAWEQGFARAAAAVVARQTATSVGITDPSSNGLFDLLPYYDLTNQPALGNSTFFPPSQAQIAIDNQTAVASMFFARLGMSGAAWLKVYIENPNFFVQFNAAYYAQFDPTVSPSLAGNIPSLTAIAGTLLPNGVEGQPWSTWYQQQNILNTSNSAGEQLFAFTIPGTYNPNDATAGQSTPLFLTYFIGQKNGDETLPTSATAYATYLDSTDARLTGLGTTANQASIVNGEGGLTTLTFPTQAVDSGRITVDVHCNNASTRTYFPSGFTGDFQAVVLGPNTAGGASVTESTVPSVTVRTQTGSLTNAAFGVALGSATTDLAVTTVTLDNGGAAPSIFKINTGDGQYYAVIRRGVTGGGTVTLTHTFTTSELPSIVTYPVQPLNPIVDQALGLDGSAFVLSYWDVTQSLYETIIPGQPSVAPIQMGRGYWFKLEPTAAYTSQLVSVTGVAPSTDTDYTLGLSYGWNLIGSPFAQPIDISTILVQYGQNDAISFGDAVDKSLIAASPFSWDPTSASYSTVSTIDGTNWEGYWLRVLVPSGVTLLLPGPDATSRAATLHRAALHRSQSAATPTPAPDWQINLRATQTGSVMLAGRSGQRSYRSAVAFGVGRAVKATGFDNRYDREAPPAVASTLAVAFPHKEWGDSRSTNRYVADFRSTAAATLNATWNVDVQTPTAGSVTLSWDGVDGVPRSTKLVLIDSATNTRLLLRARSSYAFTAVAGQTRSFQIVSEPERSQPLTIMPLFTPVTRSPRVNGGRGASGVNIGYMLSADAEVTVSFTALNGRVVHQIGATRAAATLAQNALWDGKGLNGQALPAGLYRVEIIARADDGTEVRYVRPITLLQ